MRVLPHHILGLLSLLLLFQPACRSVGTVQATFDTPSPDRDGDSEAIGRIIDDWNRAWAIEDPVLAASGYDEVANFTNAFGFHRTGRKAIEAYLAEVFDMPFVMAGDSQEVERELRFLATDVAIVRSRIERAGQQLGDGEELETRRTSHLRVFTRGEHGWAITSHLISDARATGRARH